MRDGLTDRRIEGSIRGLHGSKYTNALINIFEVELAEIRCSSDLASVSWLYFATKEKNFAFDKFTTDFRQRKTLTTS